jgi:hypothetical protein
MTLSLLIAGLAIAAVAGSFNRHANRPHRIGVNPTTTLAPAGQED